jgi:hypothetical protein
MNMARGPGGLVAATSGPAALAPMVSQLLQPKYMYFSEKSD